MADNRTARKPSLGNLAAHIYRVGRDRGVTMSVVFHIGRGLGARDFATGVINVCDRNGLNASLVERGGFLGRGRLYGIRHNGSADTIALFARVLEGALAQLAYPVK